MIKQLVDVNSLEGRSFKIRQSIFTRKLFSLFFCNNPVGQVCFVSNKDLCNIFAGVRVNLLQPVSYVIECELLCAVKHKNYAHCPFVVCLGDCTKSFLSSSVPDLQFNSLVINRDSLNFEIDSYTF